MKILVLALVGLFIAPLAWGDPPWKSGQTVYSATYGVGTVVDDTADVTVHFHTGDVTFRRPHVDAQLEYAIDVFSYRDFSFKPGMWLTDSKGSAAFVNQIFNKGTVHYTVFSPEGTSVGGFIFSATEDDVQRNMAFDSFVDFTREKEGQSQSPTDDTVMDQEYARQALANEGVSEEVTTLAGAIAADSGRLYQRIDASRVRDIDLFVDRLEEKAEAGDPRVRNGVVDLVVDVNSRHATVAEDILRLSDYLNLTEHMKIAESAGEKGLSVYVTDITDHGAPHSRLVTHGVFCQISMKEI